MKVIVDIETEGLDSPQKIWVVVLKEIDTGKTHIFKNLHLNNTDSDSFIKFSEKVTQWIGHNIIGFDLPVLEAHGFGPFDQSKVLDTLVCSRTFNFGVEGGHSLEAIGKRLGKPKGNFKDFSNLTQEMIDYCVQDVEVTYSYYNTISRHLESSFWKQPLELEHQVAFICRDMSFNGFYFNISKAKELYQEITQKLSSLDQILEQAFPCRSKFIREITPRETKHGTLHRGDFRWLQSSDLTPFSPGASFSLFEFEPFNPGSPKQIVERLNEAGWQPTEKTKGHIQAERNRDKARLDYFRQYGWTISETNLSTLPDTAPEAAKRLVERLLLDSRRSTLEEWFNAYKESTGRIHGKFHNIGAWTGRMSHSGPNMANIPAGDSPYAKPMRSLWGAPKDRLLVGVDAEGIQLRILAHYMNDKGFTEALVNGRKEDGTDAHTMNMKALGSVCSSRDTAKTFIYAWLLGAGDAKVAEILGCTLREAKEARKDFLSFYPGLKYLKDVLIPRDAKRGYFVGLDGRAVKCDSEHLMLAGYLQNGEAVVMKKANVLWRNKLTDQKIDFKQVNFVHDEWQIEVPNDLELAKQVAEIVSDSIRQVGLDLNLRCPLAGSVMNQYKQLAIGQTWNETH